MNDIQLPLPQPASRRRWRSIFAAFALFATVLNFGAWTYAPQAVAAEVATKKSHHVVLLIDSDEEKVMRHAIAYIVNLSRAYSEKDEPLSIEVVANGSGIKLFRADTSPFLKELTALRGAYADVTYSMCGSSHALAEQRENKSIPVMEGARLVPFGISRVVELQEQGWTLIQG